MFKDTSTLADNSSSASFFLSLSPFLFYFHSVRFRSSFELGKCCNFPLLIIKSIIRSLNFFPPHLLWITYWTLQWDFQTLQDLLLETYPNLTGPFAWNVTLPKLFRTFHLKWLCPNFTRPFTWNVTLPKLFRPGTRHLGFPSFVQTLCTVLSRHFQGPSHSVSIRFQGVYIYIYNLSFISLYHISNHTVHGPWVCSPSPITYCDLEHNEIVSVYMCRTKKSNWS